MKKRAVKKNVTKKFEQRWCSTCGRVTMHLVTQQRSGGGEVLADPGDCKEHEKFVSGKVKFRDPRTSEWSETRPGLF